MTIDRLRLVLVLLALTLIPQRAWSQNPPPARSSEPTFTAEEQAARQQILQSSQWRTMRQSFNEWLSVQKIYTEQEIADLQEELERHIRTMTASELHDFMQDTEERLTLLLSDEAMAARAYLDPFTIPARRKRLGLAEGEDPNVFGMSTAQLRQELYEFQQRRAASTAAQAQFDRNRAQQVAGIQQRNEQQQASAQQARRSAGSAGSGQQSPVRTPYSPRSQPTGPRPTPTFYVGPFGGISRTLP